MKLTLTLHGFKSADREVQLDHLNLVVGNNGTGKSAIADALRFLALGYVPSLGKREQDTALLMSNGRLEVILSLEDGRTATRTLERDGEGYRSTVRASWVRGSRAEHDVAILKLFGSDVEDVAEALDIRELLSLSPAKRAARIEKMVGTATSDDLPRRVARHHVARLLDQDADQLPEKLSDAIGTLPPSRVRALRGVAGTVASTLREKGIPALITWANEQKRDAAAAAAKRKAARDEIEARLGTLGGTTAVTELEAQRNALQRQIGARQQWQRREAERSKQLDAALSEQAKTEGTLGDAQSMLDRIEETAAGMIEALEAKLPEFDEQIGVLRAQTFGTHVDTARLETLEAELAGIEDEPVEDLTRYERIVEDLEQELTGARANPWAEVSIIADHLAKEVGSIVACDAAKRLRYLAEANMPSTADIEAGLAAARENLTKRGDQAAGVATRNLERANRRSRLGIEIKQLRAQADGADASIRERERKRDNEIEALQAKKKSAVAAIAEQRAKLGAQQVHVSELRDKLTGLTARVTSLSAASPEVAEVDLAELDRIDVAIGAMTARSSLKAEFDAIVLELEERDAEVEIYRALEWALQRVREEELATTGAGIVGTIANFLTAAGRDELPYMHSSKNLCEIGWVRPDKRRVSVDAMSGGEYALFCAALTAAVLTARGGELRVLMIEAAEADPAVLNEILCGIEGMSAITNALVLTAHAPDTIASNWNFVALESVAQERAA